MSEKFLSAENDGVFVVTCPPLIDGKGDQDLEAIVKMWLTSMADLHILDFANVTALKSSAYRPFVVYSQTLKQNDKHLFCINFPEKLLPQIRQDGLTSVFVPVKTIEEAKAKVKPTGGKSLFDVEFVNPFIAGTKKVLETQVGLKLVPGKPVIKKAGEIIYPFEIAGVISLSAKEFTGTISICFRQPVFLALYEKMVGEKHESITLETQDAAGELLNMIFGHAKTVLNDQKGYTLEKAIPTIMVGKDMRMQTKTKNPSVIVPFESEVGQFHLEISVE